MKVFPVFAFAFVLLISPARGICQKSIFPVSPLGPPVDIPMTLSANFGELRTDHFHSGIDIKTQGKTGLPVLAAADGFISRIGISPGGFGKALYIAHPDGHTTVYAHLRSFTPEVEAWAKNEQYLKKNYTVNLFPEPGHFPVSRGQQIGLSGNTGSSDGPHLHFEVRNTRNQNPIDPLEFYRDIPDDMPPIIQSLIVYPLDAGSLVEGKRAKKFFQVSGSKGKYSVQGKKNLEVYGCFGIGLEAIDYLNHSWNKCGISTLEVLLDGQAIYSHSMDEFSFSESRYINSHIDYAERISSGRKIQKTFLQPNNRLGIYGNVRNSGRITLTDSLLHTVLVRMGDAHGNESLLSFQVRNVRPEVMPEADIPSFTALFRWDTDNRYSTEDFSISLKAGTLYDTLRFTYSKSESPSGYLSSIHHIHRNTTPSHGYFQVWIRPDSFPEGLEKKLLLVKPGNGNGPVAAGGNWESGFVTGRIREFGSYAVAIDTLPPGIEPVNIHPGKKMTGQNDILLKINDELSGIKTYHAYIDNRWALFEYDAKNDLLVYRFDDERLEKNTWHELVLTVIDEKDNFSVYHTRFFR